MSLARGTKAKMEAGPNAVPKGFEFVSLQGCVGTLVQNWRIESGVSLRVLEARSGVSHSEISKVEKGSQSCRLESFIRVCAALGLPVYAILDHAVVFDPLQFEDGVKCHWLIQQVSLKNLVFEKALVKLLAALAALASGLVISSRPAEKASIIRFHHHQLEQRLLQFGHYLESSVDPQKRVSLLLSLKNRPVDALMEEKMISLPFLQEIIKEIPMERLAENLEIFERLVSLRSYGAAKLISSGIAGKIPIDKVGVSANSEFVKHTLPNLLDRLKKATQEHGKKSELANFLGVELVSVSKWLSGAREPGGETTLRMLQWVEHQERQK